ncbi:hypothetical protein ACLOJK_015998 [Asimina triloba]
MEQEESQEMRISLLHSSIDDDAPPPPHTSLIAYLYAGHFLGRWDSQLFAAIYGAVESASTALFGSVIGQWVDRFTYFKVLRAWLLAQNLSFIVAGGTVTTLLIYHALKSSGFTAFMSLVVLPMYQEPLRMGCGDFKWPTARNIDIMNSVIRRFVLICKLFAPIVAGFIISFVSLKASAITLAIWNTVSGIPALSESNHMRSMTAVLDDSLSSSSDEKEATSLMPEGNNSGTSLMPEGNNSGTSLMPEGNNSGIEENDQKLKTAERILRLPCMDAWVVYLKQDVVLPGVALALLYFSILSFGTLMTASLEWKVGLSAASMYHGRVHRATTYFFMKACSVACWNSKSGLSIFVVRTCRRKAGIEDLRKKLEQGLVPDAELKKLIRIQLGKRLQWGYKPTYEERLAQVLELANSAVREWKLEFPTSKIDDCAVVCLYLDGKMDSESKAVESISGITGAAVRIHPPSRKASDPNLLMGAIVGGPDAYDNFADDRKNYEQTEPTTYNNAPLLGVLARLNSRNGGLNQLLPCRILCFGTEVSASPSHATVTDDVPKSSMQGKGQHRHSISISMPSSPAGIQLEGRKRVLFSGKDGNNEAAILAKNASVSSPQQPKQAKFHSQPLPEGPVAYGKLLVSLEQHQTNLRKICFKDKRFDSFKTWSGKLEKKITNLRGKQQEVEADGNDSRHAESEALPVDRYFAALEGPELDTLRASEESVLPEDKTWPFLLRFPVSAFGICLGISSQAILWKTLATSKSMSFLHISPTINLILWCIAIVVMAVITCVYSFKVIFYFEAVRREYYHPIRVNFFFAPWIACLFLALGVPPHIAENLPAALWYVLMTPILLLELKIYGQWMSGGQRRLSKVANPSNHLSAIGNFVGALLGASMGLKEGPIFFFAVGLAHYTVLFVTLYQRLPTNETLPKELHPVFFLFVAAPSVASMAWARIQGYFDYCARIAYFIALFLYLSLAVRVNFFRGFRFSLAWWAYTFPMTGASIATVRYANAVENPFTQSLSVVLSTLSTLTVTALLVSTVVHAFVLRNLFPNDIAIAITGRRHKGSKRCSQLQTGSSDANDTDPHVSSDDSVM